MDRVLRPSLSLGRKLAADCEDHDVTGQWMAHHLATLVITADGADEITIEQRTEIVKTILMVWSARRTFPGPVPAYETDTVLSALDVLGDGRSWKFSRLEQYSGALDAADAAGVPLVVKASALEQLTRKAVLALCWMAFQSAAAHNEDWLVAATAAMAPAEDKLTSTTRRVRQRLRELSDTEALTDSDTDGTPVADVHVLVEDLRAMAAELVAVADEARQRISRRRWVRDLRSTGASRAITTALGRAGDRWNVPGVRPRDLQRPTGASRLEGPRMRGR